MSAKKGVETGWPKTRVSGLARLAHLFFLIFFKIIFFILMGQSALKKGRGIFWAHFCSADRGVLTPLTTSHVESLTGTF